MASIVIRKFYADTGESQIIASNRKGNHREDVSSITKVPLIHALLEKAYNGQLRAWGHLEHAGKDGVDEFVAKEWEALTRTARRSSNNDPYMLAYKYGGELAAIEAELDAETGLLADEKLKALVHGGDPYGGRVGVSVGWMNDLATNAGAQNTHFTTPHGHTGIGRNDRRPRDGVKWPEAKTLSDPIAQHHSTANDMSLMTARFLAEFPDVFAQIFGNDDATQRHTLQRVLNTKSGLKGDWKMLGGKSGTGTGYWAGSPRETPFNLLWHKNAGRQTGGRYHGLTVAQKMDEHDTPTGEYIIFSVTGAKTPRERQTVLEGLWRSQWKLNGVRYYSAPAEEEAALANSVLLQEPLPDPELLRQERIREQVAQACVELGVLAEQDAPHAHFPPVAPAPDLNTCIAGR